MSKYIKLEDAIERLNQLYHSYEVEEWLKSLPTIEVSDDCISKRRLLAEIDDLADEFSEVDENGLHSERWCGIMDAKGVIVNAPSVVPSCQKNRQVERAEGEWLFCPDVPTGGGAKSDVYVCSKCGCTVLFTRSDCPKCRAKMKGTD